MSQIAQSASNVSTISNLLTNNWEIKHQIKQSKNRKAPGVDNINNLVLKHLPNKAIAFLTKLFNACITIGYFPAPWKTAKVIPTPKPGKDLTNPKSYRPISLLSSVCKIFETILLQQVLRHVDNNHILPDVQFSFRKHTSTTHQLARVTKYIQRSLQHQQSTGLVTLDIEKAFDSIWHDGLIHKLHVNNFPIPLIRILNSFLRDRCFFVSVSSSESPTHKIPAGLPQGSCLSPILFNVYTADIAINRLTQVALFADDTAIYCSDPHPIVIISKLERTLASLALYFSDWKIKINKNKTQAIFFSKRRAKRHLPTRNIVFDGDPVVWHTELKYLGIVYDNKLTFQKHCEYANNRAQIYIKILYPLLHRHSKLNPQNKLLIFKCILLPIILYACPIWGRCAETHKKALQITQNQVLKLVYNLPYLYSTERLHINTHTMFVNTNIFNTSHTFYQNCTHSSNPIIAAICNS